MKKRTYIDANVLIAAFQGEELVARRALQVLDDPNRKLVVSDYLRLEVLPKPTFHKIQEEIDFMQVIFDNASENVGLLFFPLSRQRFHRSRDFFQAVSVLVAPVTHQDQGQAYGPCHIP